MTNKPTDPQRGQVWRKGSDWREIIMAGLGTVWFWMFGSEQDFRLSFSEWHEWSADAVLVAGPGSDEEQKQ